MTGVTPLPSHLSLHPSLRWRFIDKDERASFHNNVNNSPLSSVQKRQADPNGCAVSRPAAPGCGESARLGMMRIHTSGCYTANMAELTSKATVLYNCRLTPSFTSISFNPLVTFNPAQFIQCIIHTVAWLLESNSGVYLMWSFICNCWSGQ